MPPVDLRCRICDVPFATLQNGAIVIESRHHGQKHINTIAIADLLAYICRPGELQEVLSLIYKLRQRYAETMYEMQNLQKNRFWNSYFLLE